MNRSDMDPTPVLAVRAAAEEIMPGTPCRVGVSVTNLGSDVTTVSVSVVGLDPSWVLLPPDLGPLAPGAVGTTEVVVTVPLGHPASQLLASVVARDATGGQAAGDLQLTVADGSVVAATLEPAEARGGWRGRADLVLRNRGRTPIRVDLASSSPDREMKISLADSTQLLAPGQEVRVRARLSGPRPVVTSERRRPYSIGVRTRGTPVFVEGAFVQRSFMPLWAAKALAIIVVVALWAGVAAVGISTISARVNRSANQQAANNNPPASVPAGPTGGGGTGSSSGGGSGGSGGSGAGNSATGGGSSASGGGGSGAATGQLPSKLSGKVAAKTPGGVTVTVSPTSLTDSPTPVAVAAAQIAPETSSQVELTAASTSAPLTKLYGPALTSAPLPTQAGAQVRAISTTTSPDGFWAIAGLSQPGYYLVSFSKAGYATADYVVNVAGDGKPISLAARLVPGPGSMSGTVDGPGGPLGGVQLTITDGTVSLTTRTPTVGAVGTWSVQGLTTPDTYLITASLPGYSTQTSLVTLGAGSSQGSVTLNMAPGQGSVSGTIVSTRTGQPVGGLTVTVANAAASRTTTSTTVGAVGTYSLPDLPVPGTYALTVSGPGYVTQTQQVSLTADPTTDNITVNATVTPSTAEVAGVASSGGSGLAGAGAVLANQQNVYKTLTTSAGTVGSFDFPQVPPGQYVLTIEKYGYATQSSQVTVAPGQLQTVDLSLTPVPPQSLSTGTIQGVAESLATAKPVVGAQIEIDGQPTSVTTDSNGAFAVQNIAPGTHTVTATCPTNTTCQSLDVATGSLAPVAFESTTVQVTVALGALAFAPTILMPQLDRLAGVVVDGTGAPVPNPVVTLTNAQTGTVYKQATNPVASGTTAAKGGFEFDGLPHGNYTLLVTGPPVTGAGACAGISPYKPLTTSIQLQPGVDVLLNGAPGTAEPSPVLTLLPEYRVQPEIFPANATAPVATPGVTITVNGVPGTPSAGFTLTCTGSSTGSNEVDIPLPVSLVGAPFTASFTYTDSSGVTYTAPPSAQFTAVYNNTTVDTALLVPPTPGVTLTLSFEWRTPTQLLSCAVTSTAVGSCPALSANDLPTTVALNTTVATSGGGTAPHTVFATPGAGAGVWTIPAAALTDTVPGNVTFAVSGGAFQSFSFPSSTSTTGFASQAFTLTPNMSTVTGVLSSPLGASISVSPAGSGLSVTTNSSGNIVWQQSGQQTGLAYPGFYTITFAASGYDSAVLQGFSVPLCDSTCSDTLGIGDGVPPVVTPGTLTYLTSPTASPSANLGTLPISLDAHAELTVTPGYTPLPGLGFATVTVQNALGQSVGSYPLSATNGTATFNDLSATTSPYSVTVAAPGYQTSVTSAQVIASTTAVPVPDDPILNEEGYLSGKVQGVINQSASALANVAVTATLTTPGPGCTAGSASAPNTLNATTDINGAFTIINSAPTDGGFCIGSVYSVAVTPPSGYSTPTGSPYTVTIAAGDTQVNGGTAIQAVATPVSQLFTVTAGGQPLAGVLVNGVSLIGSNVSGSTDATGSVTLTPDPTQYTFTFSLAGYNTVSYVINYPVGQTAPTFPVTMTPKTYSIQGVVTTPGSCTGGNPCPLAGVTVTLLDSSNKVVDSTTTATNGSYTLPSSTKVNIYSGSYLLQATLAGYQYSPGYQQSFQTGATQTTIQDVSLTPTPVTVGLTVTSSLTGASLLGDIVSLTPTTPPSGLAVPLTCSPSGALAVTGQGGSLNTQVGTGGKASFSNVVPDYYDLVVSGSNIPAQTPDGLVVCPGGNVAEYVPAGTTTGASNKAAFVVEMGTISGTAAVSANSSISVTDLSVTFTDSTTKQLVDTVSVGSNGKFTSDYLPLGSYTVQATGPSGYSPSSPATASISSSTPTATVSTLTVSPTPVEVDITVDDATTKAGVANQTVTLQNTDFGTPYPTAITDANGVAKFTSVQPDPNKAYTITVGTLTISGTNTVQVPIGTGPVPATVLVDYTGGITGTFTNNTTAGSVTITATCASCTPTTATTTASGTSYTFTGLAPGSYTISATGATVSGTNPVSVTSGAPVNGPSVTYSGGSLSVSAVAGKTLKASDTVKVTLCSDSLCGSPVGSYSFTVTTTTTTPISYTFKDLAPGSYYTEATSTGSNTLTASPAGTGGVSGPFTVTAGATATGTAYTDG